MPSSLSPVPDWPLLLARQPALAAIPPQLQASGEMLTVAAGQTLARIGDRVRQVFSVVKGEVRLIRRDAEGTEMILQRSRGGFIAEASLDANFYHCDLVAAEAGEVLSFPAPVFRQALQEHGPFRDAWMGHLAREVRRLRAQCERLNLKGAAARIFHYIESEGSGGTVLLQHSRKAWAAELGLSHEALYRTLRRLENEGRLALSGECITRLDMPER